MASDRNRSGSSREVGRIPRLPDEIILQILDYLPDISTLYEITNIINPHALDNPPWGFLSRFVDRHPLQMQKLIRFVICVRYAKTPEKGLEKRLISNLENLKPLPVSTVPGLRNVFGRDNFDQKLLYLLVRHRRTAEIPPSLILGLIHDPAAILQDMSTVSSDMEQVIRSFVNARLHRTHEKMRDLMTEEHRVRFRHCNGEDHSKVVHEEHWGPGYCLKACPSKPEIGTKPVPPLHTELHRIRRAFWRLLVYGDLFYATNPKYPFVRKKEFLSLDGLSEFKETLTVWELKELECAYYHLREQMELWADPRSSCYQPGPSAGVGPRSFMV